MRFLVHRVRRNSATGVSEDPHVQGYSSVLKGTRFLAHGDPKNLLVQWSFSVTPVVEFLRIPVCSDNTPQTLYWERLGGVWRAGCSETPLPELYSRAQRYSTDPYRERGFWCTETPLPVFLRIPSASYSTILTDVL